MSNNTKTTKTSGAPTRIDNEKPALSSFLSGIEISKRPSDATKLDSPHKEEPRHLNFLLQRLSHFLFNSLVNLCAMFMTAVLAHPDVQAAGSALMVRGLNDFVTQPDLNETMQIFSETMAKGQEDFARNAGQDFPKLAGKFFEGMFSKDKDQTQNQQQQQPQQGSTAAVEEKENQLKGIFGFHLSEKQPAAPKQDDRLALFFPDSKKGDEQRKPFFEGVFGKPQEKQTKRIEQKTAEQQQELKMEKDSTKVYSSSGSSKGDRPASTQDESSKADASAVQQRAETPLREKKGNKQEGQQATSGDVPSKQAEEALGPLAKWAGPFRKSIVSAKTPPRSPHLLANSSTASSMENNPALTLLLGCGGTGEPCSNSPESSETSSKIFVPNLNKGSQQSPVASTSTTAATTLEEDDKQQKQQQSLPTNSL